MAKLMKGEAFRLETQRDNLEPPCEYGTRHYHARSIEELRAGVAHARKPANRFWFWHFSVHALARLDDRAVMDLCCELGQSEADNWEIGTPETLTGYRITMPGMSVGELLGMDAPAYWHHNVAWAGLWNKHRDRHDDWFWHTRPELLKMGPMDADGTLPYDKRNARVPLRIRLVLWLRNFAAGMFRTPCIA